MRIAIPALIAALAAGCTRDRVDASHERDMVRYESDTLLYLELQSRRPDIPQHDGPDPAAPNLDAWKAGVLEKADEATLAQMDRDCRARAAWLRDRAATLSASPDPTVGGELIAVRDQLTTEEKKIALIEERRNSLR